MRIARVHCLALLLILGIAAPLSAQSSDPAELDPQRAFERLFGGNADGAGNANGENGDVVAFPPPVPPPSEPAVIPDSGSPLYVIRPNDTLRIHVYGQPDLSGTALVRPDGRISLPLVQDLEVAGRTPGEVKGAYEQVLSGYLEIPVVTVIVENIQSYRIYVMGQVVRPGELINEKPLTVLQALALAGGFAQFAKRGDIVIFRNEGSEITVFPFDYNEVIKGGNFGQDRLLEPGDVVVVP